MKRIVFLTPLLWLLVCFFCKSSESAPDHRIPFDRDWKFALSDHKGAEQPGFDDSEWRLLDVPHDFSMEHPFDSTYATGPGGGYTYSGIGWYRKTFRTAPDLSEKLVSVLFDGVYRNSETWINGHYLGIWPYGYSSFYYDLTPYLNPTGEENVLAVKVNTTEQPNSRWYTGSGIYRHVWLVATNKVHINQWGVFARTVHADEREASVAVSIELSNESDADVSCTIITSLLDATGKLAGRAESQEQLKTGSLRTIDQHIKVNNPMLWSVAQPNLYCLQVEVKKGNTVADSNVTPFGIRTFHFDPDKGFSLNGKQVKLKGVNNHHDGGPLGAAVFDYTHKRQLAILKEMGCNAIRISHNPPSPELLTYADSLGFVVINEIFDEWMDGKRAAGYAAHFMEWFEKDVENWIRRDRNHPSVIAWSIGNEVKEQYNKDNALKITQMLLDASRRHDNTRPFTAGCNEIVNVNAFGMGELLDLVGYNYQEAFYKTDHERYPNRVIYGSKGTDGVIIITTKRGGITPPKIAYEFSAGIQQLTEKLPVMNLQEFATFVNAVRSTGGRNTYRTLVIQGSSEMLNVNDFPTDPIPERIMYEEHNYTPFQFTALGEDVSWGRMFYYWGTGHHSLMEPDRNATWGGEDAHDQYFKNKGEVCGQRDTCING